MTTRGDRWELKEALKSTRDADEVIVIKDIPRLEHITRLHEGIQKATGDFLMTMTDRTILLSGWRKALEESLEKIGGSGCVTFDSNFCGLAGVTRDYLEKELGGYFYWPDYIHYNGDQELGERARRDKKYIEVPDGDKYNFRFPKRYTDQSQEYVEYDKEVYHTRTNLGWPNIRVRTDEERLEALKKGGIEL